METQLTPDTLTKPPAQPITEAEVIQGRVTAFMQTVLAEHPSLDMVSVNFGWTDIHNKSPSGVVIPRNSTDLNMRQMLQLFDTSVASARFSVMNLARFANAMASAAEDAQRNSTPAQENVGEQQPPDTTQQPAAA